MAPLRFQDDVRFAEPVFNILIPLALRDADLGCALRILSRIDLAGQFEWCDLLMQPGALLASQAHGPGAREHLNVLSGTLTLLAGSTTASLAAGETARHAADQPHTFRNSGSVPCSALLVVLHSG